MLTSVRKQEPPDKVCDRCGGIGEFPAKPGKTRPCLDCADRMADGNEPDCSYRVCGKCGGIGRIPEDTPLDSAMRKKSPKRKRATKKKNQMAVYW